MNARQDQNRAFTLIGVGGTAGTADASGTADIVQIGVNQTTGAMFVQDLSGASGTTNVLIVGGTLDAGTVVVGSIANVGVIHNAGTLAAGANNIGDVDIATGTVTLLSTVTTVSNLTSGSVRMTVGTLTTGSLTDVANLYSGSVRMTIGTLTTGSLTNLASLHTGTIQSVSEVVKGTTTLVSTVTTVSNLTTGSIVVTSGTLGSVAAVAQVHNAGTIQAGTVQINPDPVPTMLVLGTLGTAGGSFFATISAASGAGTKHFISGVDIIQQSGTADVRVLTGTGIQGTGVLAAGWFGPSGGISKVFNPAFETGTNSEITYHFVGAGTAFIHVSYWKGV